jgi:glycosyltransferase involved in cell wall biosynthesis
MKENVLHIVDSFDQGGTERQAVQLARLLTEAGNYRVQLACLKRRGLLLGEAESLGLGEIVEFPLTSFYDKNFAMQLRRLKRLLREREIRIIHTHDFYTNIFGMTGAWLARVPARIASKRETAFRTAAQQRLERLSFKLAHKVVANAEAVRRRLVDEGTPAAKIVTLYNGLDTTRVRVPDGWQRETALTALGLPLSPERKFISIVANLRHRVKDIPLFLRAAQRVRAKVSDAAFVIAGEGELLAEMQSEAARLGISDDVFFIGRCTRVADLLAVSSACVLSSQAEGFSNSILEYMAAGRAVVVTDVGGAREAVSEGESGYLVPAGDEAAMAARLVELLSEPERAQLMGERGRALVEQNFSCAAQLARTEDLYERLLATPT